MSSIWKVTYQLGEPVDVAAPLAGYPSLGLVFEYAQDGKMEALVHEVELDDSAIVDDARALSSATLRLLLVLLRALRSLIGGSSELEDDLFTAVAVNSNNASFVGLFEPHIASIK